VLWNEGNLLRETVCGACEGGGGRRREENGGERRRSFHILSPEILERFGSGEFGQNGGGGGGSGLGGKPWLGTGGFVGLTHYGLRCVHFEMKSNYQDISSL
jgi:hypothetical protein